MSAKLALCLRLRALLASRWALSQEAAAAAVGTSASALTLLEETKLLELAELLALLTGGKQGADATLTGLLVCRWNWDLATRFTASAMSAQLLQLLYVHCPQAQGPALPLATRLFD